MQENSWLFPDISKVEAEGKTAEGPINIHEYMDYFGRKQRLIAFPNPVPYTLDLLKKNKENIVFSHVLLDEGVAKNYTVMQFNEGTTHVVLDWMFDQDETEFLFQATVFAPSHKQYWDFKTKNRDLEKCEQRSGLGFGNK